MISKYEGLDRAQFYALSDKIQTAKVLQGIEAGVNELLLQLYKKDIQETTGENPGPAKTFHQWKEEGRKVRKGSKAFKIYSRPKSEIKAEKGEVPDEKDNKRFFIANIFFQIQTQTDEDSNS